jgi:predicted phosphodiesterase
MPLPVCSEEDFISLWYSLKSGTEVAKALGVDLRGVMHRRRRIEKKHNILLETNDRKITVSPEILAQQHQDRIEATRHHVRRGTTIQNGRVLVFSDAHFYPDDTTTAFRALIECIKEFQPEVIICNGDAFDGTTTSRHARINWSDAPSVIEELQAVQYYLGEIENATKFHDNLIWTLGNHDARFETFLSAQVPQYQNIKGFALKDHFPIWKSCWSYFINNDTQIKHLWKGGKFGGANNTLHSGLNIVTGHTHVLSVDPYTDHSPHYKNSTRYGVQTGTLAYPKGDQFIDYCQDNPVNWRSGFVLMTWHQGHLLCPEMISVWDEQEGEVQFRGKVYNV